MSGTELVQAAVILCLIYLLVVYAFSGVLLLASSIEHVYRIRRSLSETDPILPDSTVATPVSVLAPMYNEAGIIVSVVRTLLAQDYPHHEVIVINDGSTDETMEVLTQAFDLEPRAVFYRRRLTTKRLRGAYISRAHRNLMVVDKDNGGKADALNCGLNFARHRFLCTIDGDTMYLPDALKKGMAAVQEDPETVVGVTCPVAIRRAPEAGFSVGFRQHRVDVDPITNLQLLDYFRSFLTNRLGAARWGFMLCASGAFALWRRDLVLELGGFSPDFTCEDIEFTFRAHEHFRKRGRPYRIVSLGSTAGTTESPPSLRALVQQRARWQRVIAETVWAYRHMFLNPRYGSVGTLGMPYYVVAEVLAAPMQLLAAVTLFVAWATGQLDVRTLQLLLIVALMNGIVTNIAVTLHDAHTRAYPIKDLVQLVLLGPLDVFIYRPVLIVAHTKGIVDFLRGEKSWHKFERARRAAGP